MINELKAITSLDGRYKEYTQKYSEIFSEFGLIKHRFIVEMNWLEFILKDLRLSEIEIPEIEKIDNLRNSFNIDSALRIKEIEKVTNHDVKAVEYYIKEELENYDLVKYKEFVHFACTSEDINNTAYALMIKEGRIIIIDLLRKLLNKIEELAQKNKKTPMMSRTHGQAASPTTIGKEFINFAWRIKKEISILENINIEAKINGATGNYNAHKFVYPDINWIDASKIFISKYLKVTPILFTTQINPNMYIAELMHTLIRLSSTIIDMNIDMWGYVSLGYFKQKIKEGEVGSSTMPHKVNPINFENSEGNLGLAISMMEHLAVKLLKSRYQRDLSDSTVLRNLGSIFGYLSVAINNSLKGLNKLDFNESVILKDLENNYELLAEPIQTVMRTYGEENPYEKLKELTRGKKICRNDLINFIDNLEKVPDDLKLKMKELTPSAYIGNAVELVDLYFNFK
jgi:adenylosuccinate lyase